MSFFIDFRAARRAMNDFYEPCDRGFSMLAIVGRRFGRALPVADPIPSGHGESFSTLPKCVAAIILLIAPVLGTGCASPQTHPPRVQEPFRVQDDIALLVERRQAAPPESGFEPPPDNPPPPPRREQIIPPEDRDGGIPVQYREAGVASWYGGKFHGRIGASGERYDKNELTAAHRTLPFGTLVRVRNLENQLQVIVRITDRGPWIGGRIIDLSEAAARRIGMYHPGLAYVEIEVLMWPASPWIDN